MSAPVHPSTDEGGDGLEAAAQVLEHPELWTQSTFRSTPGLHRLSRMLHTRRLHRPLHFGHVALAFYAPIGLLLLILRLVLLALFFIALLYLKDAATISRAFVYLSVPMGLFVTLLDPEGQWQTPSPPILVCNHVSELGAIALQVLGPFETLGYDFFKSSRVFRRLAAAYGYIYVPYASRTQGNTSGRDALRALLTEKVHAGIRPILCFPEGGMTNGVAGLLQYHTFLFGLGVRIQPIALSATDGPFPVHLNDESSSTMANVLWFLFLPWHRFTLRVLPPTSIGAAETPLDFAQRVMATTAAALGVTSSPFLYRHKTAYLQLRLANVAG
ncbi:hypothetical protein SPRG_12169 [Saprolegnia parasitica CBS 223.65]|uniref:Phospholipid/glycerol acyltransferase domain-containing protein n=1 Tax=Saprolegnia parasitica (strain CBS 223.65) TaxID=695850 RepID=A0A067C7H6_SAPPC|nr:hypothetical protein SPRG_12169 [Saprolegnia parasitica CBS 223.65]KDO22742.1 hypothetical protein SPRG_12169 [Saprolegnia parasitica CBS 223.65]|eukprot:XP_012206530.1 hypothetical protein SPRG_12169 [Saprolegnia parasitica CBS 223.65]